MGQRVCTWVTEWLETVSWPCLTSGSCGSSEGTWFPSPVAWPVASLPRACCQIPHLPASSKLSSECQSQEVGITGPGVSLSSGACFMLVCLDLSVRSACDEQPGSSLRPAERARFSELLPSSPPHRSQQTVLSETFGEETSCLASALTSLETSLVFS